SEKQNSSIRNTTAFDDILLKTIEHELKNDLVKGVSGLPEIDAAFTAKKINLALDQTQLPEKLESSISLLERYASWLGDPEKTLKQAYGLLEQLSKQTRNLEAEFKDKDSIDPDLNQIITQLLTTVQVEQIKFDRGDYIT
ncbi:MAG: hypothetical protein GY786_10170, partial [Proteobacteria bacterium]|nr:hypothetical protein [Pseudomonadota bacterium]